MGRRNPALSHLPGVAIVMLAVHGLSANAQAPSADREAGALEVIVVTAQRREQDVQDVPIAISTVDGFTLQQKGITSVDQLAGFVPNIDIKNTVSFAGSSQILVAAIRGIGQNDFAFNLEPGVGVYIDGVYYARSLGAVVDLLDLDRVEVLKGPQGTLFGRNTIGGALNIVTREPADTYQYALEATTGEFSRSDLRGSIDLPIDDDLRSQFSFSYKRRDGYQRRIRFPGAPGTVTDLGAYRTSGPVGGSSTQGGQNVINARMKLAFEPSNSLSFLLSADYTLADQEARPTSLETTFAAPTDPTALSAYNGCLFGGAPPFLCSNRGTLGTSYFGVNVDADPNNDRIPYDDSLLTGDIDTTYARGSNFDDLESWGLSLTTDWLLAEEHSLIAITAYRELDSQFGAEIAGAPFVANDASFDMNQRQFSQEVQLQSDLFGGRLQSLVGVYYFEESGGLLDTPVIGEGIIQIFGANDFDNEAWALFTNQNFALTDRLGLTFGVRYTEETKVFEGMQRDLNSFFLRVRGIDPSQPLPPEALAILPDPSDPTRLYPVGRPELDFDDTSIRAGVEFQPIQDVLLYYSYSEGFKSGGFTTRLLDVVTGPDPNNFDSLIFDPETAETHEIGLKSLLFDRRLRLNVAVFSTDFNDIQVTVFDGISPVFANAGQAEIDGFEIEAQTQIGSLNLNAGIGYLDAGYTTLGEGVPLSVNNDLVNAPEWTTTLGGSYELSLGAERGYVQLNADWNYRSEVSPDAENSPFLLSESIDMVNASIAYVSNDERWSVIIGGTNLADERFIVGGFDQSGPGAIGYVGTTYSPPRQWFVQFRITN